MTTDIQDNTEKIDEYIEKITKAVNYEQKKVFCNAKGLNFYFSDFIKNETQQLIQEHILEREYIFILKKINVLFEDYNDASLADRKEKINQLNILLEQFKTFKILTKEERAKSISNTFIIKYPSNGITSENWEIKSVRTIKGVGDVWTENLAKANIHTIKELLYYFPRKHLDYSNRVKIKDCKIGSLVTIWGVIKKTECFTSPRNKNITILNVLISDGTGSVSLSWFYGRANKYLQEQYKRKYPENYYVLASGTVKFDKYTKKKSLDKTEVELIGEYDNKNDIETLNTNRIVPVYPLTENLNLKWLRKTIKLALGIYQDKILDPLPKWLKQDYQLGDLPNSIKEFHFPTDNDTLQKARRRLVFDELFYFQLGFIFKRKQEEKYLNSLSLKYDGEYVNNFLKNLPFKLTNAQQRVFKEITVDLISPKPMSRLIQGDVGSGKTVVAVLTMLIAVQNGFQAALMAPTEILAEQHYRKIKDWLEKLNLNVGFLVGSQTKKTKAKILEEVENGNTNVLIGTHALIQEGVKFNNLGLVIIDEQHRFGVKQRISLRNKGQNPEVLTMTATPIPRTLALALHGDLDVSSIDELPPGRKPVETLLVRGRDRKHMWSTVKDEVENGHQIYVVFPLIEESETLTAKAATVEAERIQEKIFPEFKVGLLHGQMKNTEKEEIMNKFTNKEIDILVSTTVIEVGVDVPNATVMVIENAERFGLAQLHQLRGRVGRGADKSYCFLATDKMGDVAEQRLGIMTETNNGFIIAEQDLKLRGPGEFLGYRQSGLPDFILADLVNDTEILEEARNAAKFMIEKDNELNDYQHRFVKQELFKFFKDNVDFIFS